jgi:hypothetical protein
MENPMKRAKRERMTGHMLGYKRGDCIMFPNYNVGIVIGRLCLHVSRVEVWGDCHLHKIQNKSLRKAYKISKETLTMSPRFIACMNEDALSDTAQAVLSGTSYAQPWNEK